MKSLTILISIALYLTACGQAGPKKPLICKPKQQKIKVDTAKLKPADTPFKIDFLAQEEIDTLGTPLVCIASYTSGEKQNNNKPILYLETTEENDRALMRINGKNVILDRVFPEDVSTDTKVYKGGDYTIFLTINSWEEHPADTESTLEKGILKVVSKALNTTINVQGTSACD